ncbi:MAG: hypothetical protein HZB76_02785 [Chlamydiae bacterium]|nr:hypothetical protein [Chlamydiota bacterium]
MSSLGSAAGGVVLNSNKLVLNGIELTLKVKDNSTENKTWKIITSVALITLGLCAVALGIFLHHPLIFAVGILAASIGGYLILPTETQDALETISKAAAVAVSLLALAPLVL